MNRNSISSQKVFEFIGSRGEPVFEEEILKLGTKFNIELHLKKLINERKIGKRCLNGIEGGDITLYWILPVAGKKRPLEEDHKESIPDEDLDKQIEELSWVNERYNNEVGSHIKRLHVFNETKDIAQELIGKVASIEGETVKSLYPRYCLEEED